MEFHGGLSSFAEDKGGVIEGSAMELGRYVALLCKGNPMVLEPLFLDDSEVSSPQSSPQGDPHHNPHHHTQDGSASAALQSTWVWEELRTLARRCLFTQRAVVQYTGFVADRLGKARKALREEDVCNAAAAAAAAATMLEAGDRAAAAAAAAKQRYFILNRMDLILNMT